MKFQAGDKVEVFDVSRKIWIKAIVLMAWKQVSIPTGLKGEVYGVEGSDDIGPFNGIWDEQNIRTDKGEF